MTLGRGSPPAADDLTISLAEPGEAGLLANLMQLYIHDFSQHWSGLEQGELQDDGRFAPYPLETYWREPDRIPLLFRLRGRPAGFALLNAHGHLGRWVERNMAEFFVLRKHRRAGIGRRAAHAIFSLYPGVWEVAVARRNLSALAFWRETIASHPHVSDLERFDLEGEAWNGPLFRFEVTVDRGRTPSPRPPADQTRPPS